jgi:microcystin-dependent protein
VGTVIDFAGASAPEDYLLCDGATYPVVQYPQLAQVLGGRFRFGDMFRVPDLRGRVSVMADGSGEFSSVGQTGGEKRHQITIGEMPAHRHAGNDRTWFDRQKRNGRQSFISLNQSNGSWIATAANDGLTNGDTETGQTGGNQSMSLLQPYYTVQKIIRAK